MPNRHFIQVQGVTKLWLQILYKFSFVNYHKPLHNVMKAEPSWKLHEFFTFPIHLEQYLVVKILARIQSH